MHQVDARTSPDLMGDEMAPDIIDADRRAARQARRLWAAQSNPDTPALAELSAAVARESIMDEYEIHPIGTADRIRKLEADESRLVSDRYWLLFGATVGVWTAIILYVMRVW